jgi:hypothetical protein
MPDESTCRNCVTRYLAREDVHLYPDPELPCARPWCQLYNAILIRVSKGLPGVASLLSGVRTTMIRRLQKGE